MADNFLERHYEEYEARKAAYLRKKRHLPKQRGHQPPERPEDDAL
ncbi:MAG: dehydrogenase [Prevotella sp.]|nr:dehydrogenase [Prevotella sp.]MBQ9655706.1 dehydrogenase [Prevotella sp.]MBR1506347.1 dehydrogenase [Prevotella sp.]